MGHCFTDAANGGGDKMRNLLAFVFAVMAAVPARADAPPMAINLAPVRDWSSAQPFIDVMKTARRWIGHKPGQWGGVEYEELQARGLLDAQGWPIAVPGDLGSIGTVILTDIPEAATEAFSGRYVLRFEGEGIVEVSGRAQNTRYRDDEVRFDFEPGEGPVIIRIQRSNPDDYVRDITVMREAHVDLHEAGALFNPDWLAVIEGFEVLRFMDWANTNDSDESVWTTRAQVDDFSYSRVGVPYEVMLRLSERVGADAWITLPHLADASYVNAACTLLRDALPEGRRLWLEYSNEVWNWQFLQAEWAGQQAEARWGKPDQGTQFHGMRAAEIARQCSEIFGDVDQDRLVNVIATQTGWLGLEQGILNAPLWQAEAEGNGPPHEAFDAYAVTGYFGALGTQRLAPLVRDWLNESAEAARAEGRDLGLSGDALAAHVETHRYDLAVTRAAQELSNGSLSGNPDGTLADLRDRLYPHHAQVAERYGLDLVMYEGGTHVVGVGEVLGDDALTAFFVHLNYTPEMGALYLRLLADWQAAGGQLFNHYADVLTPGRWGSWGAQRYPGDDNPRWRTLEAWK